MNEMKMSSQQVQEMYCSFMNRKCEQQCLTLEDIEMYIYHINEITGNWSQKYRQKTI